MRRSRLASTSLVSAVKEDTSDSTWASSAGSCPLILLVDDESFVLDVQRRMVERCGLSCLTARNGAEAVDQLTTNPEVDLIVLDAILPDMNGVDLFGRLKQIKPPVRVLVCTGLAGEGPGRELCMAGADDILPKPFTATQFLERLHAVLA